jgi:hypothetical protein
VHAVPVARRVHQRAAMPSPPISREEVAGLLGDVDAAVAERIAGTGATLDELGAALDDLDHERRSGERRIPASTKIAEVREILAELERGGSPGARVIDIHGG